MGRGEVRRSLELLAGAGLAAAATLAYVIWVGRKLGPAAYAEFSTALAIVYFFAIVLSPLGPAIARVAARMCASGLEGAVASLRRKVQRSLFVTSAIAIPISLLASIHLARALRFESAAPIALAFAAAIVFSLVTVDRGFLQGLFRFRSYNASILLDAALRLGLVVALLHMSSSAAAALAAYVAALVLAGIIAGNELGKLRLEESLPTGVGKELRRLLGPMSVLMIAAAIYQNLDMLAVKRWFDPTEAGQYGAALALARTFGVIFTPLWVLLGPVLAKGLVEGKSVQRITLRTTSGYLALCAVGLLVLFLEGDRIVAILFGDAFVAGAWIAFHLGVVSTMMHTSLLLSQVFVTTENFGFIRFFVLAAAVQVVGLLLFHGSVAEVLAVLYGAQIVLLVPIGMKIAIRAREA